MSAAIDALFTQSELVNQAVGHGRTFLILTGRLAGMSFSGTLVVKSVFDPGLALGYDPRESWSLEVLLPKIDFKGEDRFTELNDSTVWKIVNADGPDFITATYEVAKVEANDR